MTANNGRTAKVSVRYAKRRLMRRKVVSDHLTILHHESNALQFGNVGGWISGHSDQISKFPWFNRADAILPP